MQALNPALSIIVPMLNESEQLAELLAHLQEWQQRGCEVLLVDGGSNDSSVETAQVQGFNVLHSPCGRGKQMNTGAAQAQGNAWSFCMPIRACLSMPMYRFLQHYNNAVGAALISSYLATVGC